PPEITLTREQCGCDHCIQPGDPVCFRAVWSDIDHAPSSVDPPCPGGDYLDPPSDWQVWFEISGPSGPNGTTVYFALEGTWSYLDTFHMQVAASLPLPLDAPAGNYTVTIWADDLSQGGPCDEGIATDSLQFTVESICPRDDCISVIIPGPGTAAAQAHF